jgi:LacI family transcriptional regulator
MVTMRDVARRVGVSPTTVSHVMNETRFVSEETRTKVYQAIRELNYQPNAIARGLRCKKTQNIGMIIPDIAYPFLAEVARGVEDASFKLNYNIILCDSNSTLEREDICIDLLREKQVDGIVFVAAGKSSEHVKTLIEQEMPVIVVDRELPGLEVDSVLADNLQGGYQATEYLIQSGHRCIGCITGPPDLSISSQRVDGYQQGLEQHDIPLCDELIVIADFSYQQGYRAMLELLTLDRRPTAVFTCNDMMALGAICAAKDNGLRVPGDIAIIGFDDIALASFTSPRLTTVAQPKHEMGAIAVELLVERIKEKNRSATKIILPVHLVVRESC